jgi:FkbM family methyltransferase
VGSLLRSSSSAAERAGRLVQRWRRGSGPVYVMGKNTFTERVLRFASAQQLPIAGIVASDLTEETWNGIPRREIGELPADAVVINCVPDGRTLTIQKQIRRMNADPLTYFELNAWSSDDFPLSFLCPPFSPEDEPALAWVLERLQDEYSRETFQRVLQFRSGLDVEVMSIFPFDVKHQYIENFIATKAYSYLVDGGVYDGTSTLALLNAYPTLGGATLLEPNVGMHASIRAVLSGRTFELVGKGLWHSPGQLRFNAGSGPASGLNENGSEIIDVIRLDDLSIQKGTFIKLDLEGAELAALQGATRTIRQQRPGLAVATYHDNRHFYQIPQFVLGMRPDYEMRVRHYTEGRLETIYYFL